MNDSRATTTSVSHDVSPPSTPTHHCAKFSGELWEPIREMVALALRWMPEISEAWDPMAGVGTLEDIIEPLGLYPVGSEIEDEYAAARDWILREDCRDHAESHRLIITSCPYGNRLSDPYLGTPDEQRIRAETGKRPRRMGYAIDLGHALDEANAARYHWGAGYRNEMASIWTAVAERTEGFLIVNVGSSFATKRRKIDNGSHDTVVEYQPVAEWTLSCLLTKGLHLVRSQFVETPGYRDGQNRGARVGGEMVYLFRRP